MKTFMTILGASFLMLASVSDAHAVVCARGVYRAGCAGPNGAVVARRPPVVVAPRRPVVVAPARHCYWRNGVRVCR
jgi:hypothetical protein